ncbi:hypothetical protein CDL12_27123 [Handroanthus impetiginosus]|uniref:WPP domain-associated protein n=1 Tax=Handroanthus impetiginosus TaxID=429701 RepID=A0A2G9G627_9LAMI|nr:hypothetical protein CDL12_27123 [Handroanthus impetiginosus]
MEIRDWLQGRIQDMKQLIVEKDRELTERLENESKLRQELELKDRELVYLQEKLEPGRTKDEDISKLKSSVDQQVLNIKQKLEDEKKSLTTERRTRKSRLSSPNLSFDFLDKERNGSSVFSEGDSDRFFNIKPQNELSRPNQNVLIRRMSSDIDVLKETLDLAFGRMQSAEVLPLEKQWRWSIEKEIESILVKGFISNLQESFGIKTNRNFTSVLCYEDIKRLTTNDRVNSDSISTHFLESAIREDLYVVFIREIIQKCKKNFMEERLLKDKRRQIASDDFRFDSSLQESMVSVLKEDIYMVFIREMAEEWKSERDDNAFETLIREDIYQFVVIEAVKDSHVRLMESEAQKQLDFQERTPRSRKWDFDSSREGTPRSRKTEDGDESLIQKLDSLLRCLEVEEDLMLRASSEIKEHSVNNSIVILNCEETDERDAIEWLITDDETTFISVSEKLERALQQLYTSKDLLVDLEQSLEESDELGETYQRERLNNIVSIEHEKTRSFLQQDDDQVSREVPSDDVLAIVAQFQQELGNAEHVLKENLERKCLRLEELKHQVDTLKEPVALLRTRKLLYKKAFISRCHNLKLAETEVDLLGDQVEALLCLLERIYVELNRNAMVFSAYFEVYDFLKLIRRELNNGRSCKSNS